MLFSNQWTEAQSLCHVVVTLLLFGSCLNPHRIAELLHAGRPVPASHEANLIMKAKCSRFTSHAGGDHESKATSLAKGFGLLRQTSLDATQFPREAHSRNQATRSGILLSGSRSRRPVQVNHTAKVVVIQKLESFFSRSQECLSEHRKCTTASCHLYKQDATVTLKSQTLVDLRVEKSRALCMRWDRRPGSPCVKRGHSGMRAT